MEIKRDSYLQQLIGRKDNGMIKVITGIRRCGKSFLLFNIFKRYLLENGVDTDHIIEIALDGIENEELRDPRVCFKYIKDVMKDDGKYYLLLDEVQFMPKFEEVLNSLLRMSNIDVYVTGSNSKFLSSDIVTEFRGYNVDVGVVEIFDKDKEGKRVRKQLEVDFVVNQGNQRYYIQVAYDMTSEEKQTQEFKSLRNIPDSFKKIVIVNGTKKPWCNDEGFVIMGMKYFLLNAESLEF